MRRIVSKSQSDASLSCRVGHARFAQTAKPTTDSRHEATFFQTHFDGSCRESKCFNLCDSFGAAAYQDSVTCPHGDWPGHKYERITSERGRFAYCMSPFGPARMTIRGLVSWERSTIWLIGSGPLAVMFRPVASNCIVPSGPCRSHPCNEPTES